MAKKTINISPQDIEHHLTIYELKGALKDKGPVLNYPEEDLPLSVEMLASGLQVVAYLMRQGIVGRKKENAFVSEVVRLFKFLMDQPADSTLRPVILKIGDLLRRGEDLLKGKEMPEEKSRIIPASKAVCQQCRRPIQDCICTNPFKKGH